MVADREIVRDREGRIRAYVTDLRTFRQISEAEFLGNRERQYAVLHALQLAIEASVEIATHICTADGPGVPSSYAEAFDRPRDAGVIDESLSEALRQMARFRNRIVHFYAKVDLAYVHRLLQERLDDFDRFLIAVERYLEQPS